jgi:hypothetical protein
MVDLKTRGANAGQHPAARGFRLVHLPMKGRKNWPGFRRTHGFQRRKPIRPGYRGIVSGKNFVFQVEHPVQPPQPLADFAPLVAVFKSFGGVGARPGGALAGRIGGVMAGPGIDRYFEMKFHFFFLVFSFPESRRDRIPIRRNGSLGDFSPPGAGSEKSEMTAESRGKSASRSRAELNPSSDRGSNLGALQILCWKSNRHSSSNRIKPAWVVSANG